MTPYKQLIDDHDPANGKIGDCTRTAYACLLDIPPEEVPHFFESYVDDDEPCLLALDVWLRGKGYYRVGLPTDAGSGGMYEVMEWWGGLNPDMYYLLTGRTGQNVLHYVVCLGDHIVHNPSRKPMLTPMTPIEDNKFLVEFLAPIDQTVFGQRLAMSNDYIEPEDRIP